MKDERHSPEKFLKQITEEERQSKLGKLKIYFGAAPGVGKTYAMLNDALLKLTQGLDVVVGIAESHGRKEIQNLLKNFEIIPRCTVIYHEKSLREFDLDAALKRNPGLILIDEMAHTNVPGLRHSKRWQDIKEILDRGIDVYTTVNVQHVESINDDVMQIVGSRIRETVPDSMIEMADTIELVDLPAEDLLKRLQEGKVYFPAQAEIAADHFFRRDKLTALRELALRITAERVGAQVLLYREGQNIHPIWPSQEKVLVCVGSGSESLKLIRTAKRIATILRTEWIALHIDTPKLKLSNEERNNAIKNLHFAERLGAEIHIIAGVDIVKEIMNCARQQNVTQIVVGKIITSRWKKIFFKDLADEIVRHSGEIDVYVVTGPFDTVPKSLSSSKKTSSWKIYGISIILVALATLFNFIFSPSIVPSNLVMIYLLVIIIVSLFGRIGPSILASILSVTCYGYFLFSSSQGFMISDFQYFFTLLVMLLVGLIISNFSILSRRQAESSYFAEYQTNILHTLSQRLASTRGIDKILETGVKYIGEVFHCEVLALHPEKIQLSIRARYQTEQMLNEKELSVAQWVYELGQKAGLGTDTLSFSDALYLPLLTTKGSIGVLRIKPQETEVLFTPETLRLLESCAHQIALALEADRIEDRDRKSELKAAMDRVRNQLLQDISHDLRTPLVAAMGTLNMIIEGKAKQNIKEMKSLAVNSYSELEKLSRLINNFLQITFLEDQSIKFEKEYLSLTALIDLAVKSMGKELDERTLQINIPADVPKIPVDATLIVDVFRHLLENAVKFTAANTRIEISAIYKKNKVIVRVSDQGPGIMHDEKDKLFEKFYRGRKIKIERGLGLGLAICKKIINAHGGEMWAENSPEGGASFCFSLPSIEVK